MSNLKEISGELLAIANLPPENRNKSLLDLSLIVQGSADYEIQPAQKDLIASIIEDLIAENDAEQIAKSKLVFVEEVEEQIAPTKKTKAKKVVAPVVKSTSDDLPDFIEKTIPIIQLPEPAPVVKTQEVKYVELLFYPPFGGVVEFKTYSIIELSALTTEILKSFNVQTLQFNFKAIADEGNYRTNISVKSSDTYSEILDNLVAQFDAFVTPELNWKPFLDRKPDVDRVSLNSEILQDSLKKKVAPLVAPIVAPKPAPVVAPKPVKVVVPKVVIPKPVKVVAPKIIPPKPAKVVAPKVVKQKVTKPKVEDDLSFLDDLDNIF